MTQPDAIAQICRYIERNTDEPLSIAALAERAAMSPYHFARRFKAIVGVTPKQYIAGVRLQRLKGGLQAQKPIDAAVYDAGYGSASRVYENAAERLGMTPAQYRRGGEGVSISYASLQSPAGLMLIAATDRGVCFVRFGDSVDVLVEELRGEYPKADIASSPSAGESAFHQWVDAIRRHLSGAQAHLDLPLDVRASAFQMRVWRYLQSIPSGDLKSYGEIAAALGVPKAPRAIARACGRNPLAVVVPCHRVIRGTGELGGYRWGIARKRALIDAERAYVKRS